MKRYVWLVLGVLLFLTLGGVAAPAGPAAGATPGQAEFSAPGPYGTTTMSVTDGSGARYEVFAPRHYGALGFRSPIVTWGNGTDAVPTMYSTLLGHFASYGLTVIASDLTNTGSGRDMYAAVRYLIHANATAGNAFTGHLDVHAVAAVGHSQGATGAVRVASMDPKVVRSLMTFSLPDAMWSHTNPDCPVVTDCEQDTALVTQPSFLISTHGPIDKIIAGPSDERAYFDGLRGHATLGIIAVTGGRAADHNSVQDARYGGRSVGELGYATAWLEYTLRGNRTAAHAFVGAHPEILANGAWPGSAVK